MNRNDFNGKNAGLTAEANGTQRGCRAHPEDVFLYPDYFAPVPQGCWQLDHELLKPLFAFILSGNSYGIYLKTLRSNRMRPAFSAPYDISGLTHALFFCAMRLIYYQLGSAVSDGKKVLLDYLLETLINMGPGEKRTLAPFDDTAAHAEAVVSVINALSFLIDRRYSTSKSTAGLDLTEDQLQELVIVELEAAADYATAALTEGHGSDIVYGDSTVLDSQILDIYGESNSAVPVISGLRELIFTIPDETAGDKRNLALFLTSAVLLEIISALAPEGNVTPGLITQILCGAKECDDCDRCRSHSGVLCVITSQPYYSSSFSTPLLPCFEGDEYLPPFTAIYCCGAPSVIVPDEGGRYYPVPDPEIEDYTDKAPGKTGDGRYYPVPDPEAGDDTEDSADEPAADTEEDAAINPMGWGRSDSDNEDDDEDYNDGYGGTETGEKSVPEPETSDESVQEPEPGTHDDPEPDREPEQEDAEPDWDHVKGEDADLESEFEASTARSRASGAASRGVPSETPPEILRDPAVPEERSGKPDYHIDDDDDSKGFSISDFWDSEDEAATKNKYY